MGPIIFLIIIYSLFTNMLSGTPNTPNVIDHEINGILVNKKDEWIKSLKKLINNPKLRIQMGDNARKKALNNYSLEVVSNSYAKVFKSIQGQ